MTKGLRPETIAGATHILTKLPRPPATLCRDGVAEWKRAGSILVERRHLSEADLGLFESYCIAFGIVRDCRRTIQREGIVFDMKGMLKRHPAVGILSDASKTVRLFGNEFGLSPISRSRSAFPEAEEAEDTADLGL